MAALSRILIVALALAPELKAEDAPLPLRDTREPFDFEADLKLLDVPLEAGETSPLDVTRAETNYERARRKEERWQKLQRAGVLSQVEYERAARQVAEAALKLEQARVAHWKTTVEELRARLAKGETSRDLLDTAETSLRNAEHLAADAQAFFKKRQLEIARANLDRQQRLLGLGMGSKAQVQAAETALEKLRAEER
jgi:outer membrane protein TolC